MRRRSFPEEHVLFCMLIDTFFRDAHLYTVAVVLYVPKPPRPKRRPDLVLEAGGGGFWRCGNQATIPGSATMTYRNSPGSETQWAPSSGA